MIRAERAACVVLFGVLLTLTALAFNAAPLLVPGVGFVAVGLMAPVLVWLPARGARVWRELRDAEIVEGERFASALVIRASRLGLVGADLCDPLGGEPVGLRLAPALRPRELRVDVLASFPRRGRKVLGPPELRLSDPLGLARAVSTGGAECEILVLPRTEPVSWHPRGGAGRRAVPEQGALTDALAASEIDGLRPYRPGTPASRIHWPALARGAGLLERRLRVEHESRPLVVLDARLPSGDSELLDRAVRAAASLVLELARRGGCGLLTIDSRRPHEVDQRLAGWPAALRRLALITPVQRAPVLATRRRAEALFYVAAEPVGRMPPVLGELGGVLVLPASLPAPGRWPVSFEVAGCVGYSVARRSAHRPRGAPAADGPDAAEAVESPSGDSIGSFAALNSRAAEGTR